ncbi:hypothetical protein Xph01_12310 [Micromonospora phaseoli]|nr:hypothetical protein Xph01_12310 [Micromonospora phaseoli]
MHDGAVGTAHHQTLTKVLDDLGPVSDDLGLGSIQGGWPKGGAGRTRAPRRDPGDTRLGKPSVAGVEVPDVGTCHQLSPTPSR